jgi:hypothetical protein
MTLLQGMDNKMHRNTKRMDVYIELDASVSLGSFLREVRRNEMDASNLQRETEPNKENGSRAYTLTLKSQKRCHHEEMIEKLSSISGVAFIDEL